MTGEATIPWPLNAEIRVEVPGGRASIRFVEDEKSFLIETVFVPAPSRHGGIGALLVLRVLMLADMTAKEVHLSARPLGVSGPEVLPRLIAWYEQFGFEMLSRDSGKALMRRPVTVAGVKAIASCSQKCSGPRSSSAHQDSTPTRKIPAEGWR